MYKLQLKPSTAWLQYMAAALSARLDKIDEEYRERLNGIGDEINQLKQRAVTTNLSPSQLQLDQSRLVYLQQASQSEGEEAERTLQEYNDQYDSLVKWLTALEKL